MDEDLKDPHLAAHYNPYIWSGAFSGDSAEEGASATAGTPKDPANPTTDESTVIEALREIYDPEIPVNIFDLGLIYKIEIAEDGTVDVLMTLTAPACPVAGELVEEVAQKVAALPGAGEVKVILTWDPPWDKDRMSEDARLALGIF
jgi:FeS assembly SUF system protein